MEAGDGELIFHDKVLKLVFVPPKSGEESSVSIQIMDKGENNSIRLAIFDCRFEYEQLLLCGFYGNALVGSPDENRSIS